MASKRSRGFNRWLGILVVGLLILALQATLTPIPCPNPSVPGPPGTNSGTEPQLRSDSKYSRNINENCFENVKTRNDSEEPFRERPFAISVGLPKSGTTSLYHFFQCSGYTTTHYCCCGSTMTEYPCSQGRLISEQIRENLIGLDFWHGTGNATVHTQLDGETKTGSYFLPQHHHLMEIHQSAPRALWILPLRPAAAWKRSVEGWLDMAQRFRVMYDEHQDPSTKASDFDLEAFYHQHTAKVRQFCKEYRDLDLCIEIDIMDPQVGTVLSNQIPHSLASCWGKHNSGPFFQAFSPG